MPSFRNPQSEILKGGLMTIRILLVDDQALFREGLRTLLSVWPDLDVIAEAGNGQEAIDTAVNLRPDVVLMDLRMPVLDGVAATRRLLEKLPNTKIIVLTTFDDDDHVFDGLRAGAVGYLLKDVPSEKLVEAIRAAAAGQSFLQPSVAAKVVAEFARLTSRPATAVPTETAVSPLVEPLSDRELEILVLVAHQHPGQIGRARPHPGGPQGQRVGPHLALPTLHGRRF